MSRLDLDVIRSKKLHTTTVFSVQQVNPVMLFVLSAQTLCKHPYPGHPNGCPNYGKKVGCPPRQQRFDCTVDCTKPVYAAWATFDIGDHARRMKRLHPGWTDRQAYCCLYWQGSLRKLMKPKVMEVLERLQALGPYRPYTRPEAMGVNVTETMRGIGVRLEWPPRERTRMIYLIGQE